MAKKQRARKAKPSAMDPAMAELMPMQETKGESKRKKNKLKQLLKSSALPSMSHSFGSKLASWEKGVAVDCGEEWSREATDPAVARGAHPAAVAPEAADPVHEDIDTRSRRALPRWSFEMKSRTGCPNTSKCRPWRSCLKQDDEGG
jgi:hypothetical protein